MRSATKTGVFKRSVRRQFRELRLYGAVRNVLYALAAVSLAGCATVERQAYTLREAASAQVPGFSSEIRFSADTEAATHFFSAPDDVDTPKLLALSGGSQDGAFGAGFLKGLTKSGRRPEFTIVTGVSTGALIAPFAFLGPRYDDHLKRAYTTVDEEDLLSQRSLLEIPFSVSLASSAPLKQLIDAYLSEAVIAEVAAEHRRGRRLFVGTVNLDTRKAVIWDMGAIASSEAPTRISLFRRIILASASVPALMPPVLIAVTADGERFEEMHVDGGVGLPILTVPNQLVINDRPPPGGSGMEIFALANNRLNGRFELVEPELDDISWHSAAMAAQRHTAAILQSTYFYADRHGLRFSLAFIADDFENVSEKRFDPRYMDALYSYGEQQGRAAGWRSEPPSM